MSDKSALSTIVSVAKKPAKAIKQELKNDFEQIVEQVGVPQKQTPQEAAETKKMVQGFYAGGENISPQKFQEMAAQNQSQTDEGVNKIIQELQQHAGKKPGEVKPSGNGNKPPANPQLAMEHHREQIADIMETRKAPSPEELARKKRAEEEEQAKLAKEKQKQEAMQAPVEAPAGRKTGVAQRKRPPTRMQPPNTSENKAGHGIGG